MLLKQKWRIKRYIASDICPELITLWKLIQTDPKSLITDYETHWNRLKTNKEYYYEIRDRFNSTRNPSDFFFLSRTCINGLIRFNKDHNFNAPLHITRKGMIPRTIRTIVYQWNTLIHNVSFECVDYRTINPHSERDFVYIDPPYSQSGSIYYGGIQISEFLDWLTHLPCGFALSFNAKHSDIENNNDVIPQKLYDQKVIVKSGKSPYKLVIHERQSEVFEYLYLKYRKITRKASKTLMITDFTKQK